MKSIQIINKIVDLLPNCVTKIEETSQDIHMDIYATFRGKMGYVSVHINKKNPESWDIGETNLIEHYQEIKDVIGDMIDGVLQ